LSSNEYPELVFTLTQYFSNVVFDKQDADKLSRTFIARSVVGNKSISKMWTNIPTAVEEY
jgi:hypothetical protein